MALTGDGRGRGGPSWGTGVKPLLRAAAQSPMRLSRIQRIRETAHPATKDALSLFREAAKRKLICTPLYHKDAEKVNSPPTICRRAATLREENPSHILEGKENHQAKKENHADEVYQRLALKLDGLAAKGFDQVEHNAAAVQAGNG